MRKFWKNLGSKNPCDRPADFSQNAGKAGYRGNMGHIGRFFSKKPQFINEKNKNTIFSELLGKRRPPKN